MIKFEGRHITDGEYSGGWLCRWITSKGHYISFVLRKEMLADDTFDTLGFIRFHKETDYLLCWDETGEQPTPKQVKKWLLTKSKG